MDRTKDFGVTGTGSLKRLVEDWDLNETPDTEVYRSIRGLKKKLGEIGLPSVVGTKRNHGFFLQNLRVRLTRLVGEDFQVTTQEFGPDGTEPRDQPLEIGEEA